VRRQLAASAVLAGALAAAGCSGIRSDAPGPTHNVPPLTLVRILPTPNGLRETEPARAVGAATIQAWLGGKTEPAAARKLQELGLKGGAVRAWATARGTGRLRIVVSQWGDHYAATSVGGDAAEIPLGSPGAHAWTPTAAAGSRGSEVGPPGPPSRAVSYAVGTIDLFVQSEGAVPQAAVVEQLTRMMAALGAASPQSG
jgi:hypothetical protein